MTSKIVHRACTICEATCGIEVHLEGDDVRQVRGDARDPFSKGRICPKMVAMKAVQDDPDRLRGPLIRRNGELVAAGWDEAFDHAAAGLARLRKLHGNDAVAVYRGNPTIHDAGTLLGARAILSVLGTRQSYSAGALDTWPRFVQCTEMYGGPVRIPVPDVDHTDYFLLVGANPLVSQGSIMTAPGIRHRLKQLQARGGRIVVVDPRCTETAAVADEYLPIVPGTDAAFLLSLMHVLFAEDLLRLGDFANRVHGLDEVAAIAGRFAPERVSAICGIPAPTIRRTAHELAAAPRAVAYGRMGTSVQPFGTLCCWALDLLCLLTGNFDRRGGIMFASPAVDLNFAFEDAGPTQLGRWRSRVSGREEMFGEFPITCLAEEIETPGEGQVRGLVTIAGNPLNTVPNSERLARAVRSLDFMVCMDYYVNETTRHADVILPPTGPLERNHYDVLLMHAAVRNIAKWSPAAIEPAPDAPDGWAASIELARRMAADPAVPYEAFEEMLVRGVLEKALLASPRSGALTVDALLEAGRHHRGVARLVDGLLRLGRYGDAGDLGNECGGEPPTSRLNLDRVRAALHGLDLGPLESRWPHCLHTPDARVRLAPARIVDDVPRLEHWMGRAHASPLRLINRRDARSMNSWLHNAAALAKGPDRCTLQIHPDDALARGLLHGRRARLISRIGSLDVPVEITDAVMKGVVSLPHGFGHGEDGVRLSVASRRPGCNVNSVSDDQLLDVPSGASALFGAEVEVVAVGEVSDDGADVHEPVPAAVDMP